MAGEKKVTGFDHLWCALYACAGFAFELLIMPIERVFGVDTADYTTVQIIVHWCVTAAAWVGIGFLVMYIGKRTTDNDILRQRSTLTPPQIFALAGCLVLDICAQWYSSEGFKPLVELSKLGMPRFVFQYIYYAAESFLIALVIVYAQKAFETWFRAEKVPFGGIVLGLTWGLAHILSKGSIGTGLAAAVSGVVYGAAYLLCGRDFRKALIVICILFVI